MASPHLTKLTPEEAGQYPLIGLYRWLKAPGLVAGA